MTTPQGNGNGTKVAVLLGAVTAITILGVTLVFRGADATTGTIVGGAIAVIGGIAGYHTTKTA